MGFDNRVEWWGGMTECGRDFSGHRAGGRRSPRDLQALSPRERQIVQLILDGSDIKRIALDLGIKTSSVRVTLHHAYRKLGISDMHELREGYGQPASFGEVEKHRVMSENGTHRDGDTAAGLGLAFFALLGMLILAVTQIPLSPLGAEREMLVVMSSLCAPIGLSIGVVCSLGGCLGAPFKSDNRTVGRWMVLHALTFAASSFGLFAAFLRGASLGDLILFAPASAIFAFELVNLGLPLFVVVKRGVRPMFNRLLLSIAVCILLALSCAVCDWSVLRLFFTLSTLFALAFPMQRTAILFGHRLLSADVADASLKSLWHSLKASFIEERFKATALFIGGMLSLCLLPIHVGLHPVFYVISVIGLCVPRLRLRGLAFPSRLREDIAFIVLCALLYAWTGQIRHCLLAFFVGVSLHAFTDESNVSCSLVEGMIFLSGFLFMYGMSLLRAWQFESYSLAPAFGVGEGASVWLIDVATLLPVVNFIFVAVTTFARYGELSTCGSVSECGSADSELRMRSYLIFRGCDGIQVDVALSCLHGESISFTARKLGYSTASIKAIRSQLYRQFDVRGVNELVNVISSECNV